MISVVHNCEGPALYACSTRRSRPRPGGGGMMGPMGWRAGDWRRLRRAGVHWRQPPCRPGRARAVQHAHAEALRDGTALLVVPPTRAALEARELRAVPLEEAEREAERVLAALSVAAPSAAPSAPPSAGHGVAWRGVVGRAWPAA
eukprot:1892130-Prymnesium_polylepis.1